MSNKPAQNRIVEEIGKTDVINAKSIKLDKNIVTNYYVKREA